MIETIDDLIHRLTVLKRELSGDTRVVLSGRREFHTFEVGVARAGVSTPFKPVSRGGTTVVVITSPSLF